MTRTDPPWDKLELAEAALARGDVDAALDGYQHILRIAPDFAEAHYGMAVVALRMGRETEAMEELKSAFAANRPYLEAGLKLADMFLARGEPEAALDAYRRVLHMAPGLAEAHYGIASVAFRMGHDAEAMAEFRYAFAAHPPHLEAGLKLADMLLARGEPEAALDTYRRIVAMNPGIVEAHYGAAITALQMGRDTEAMEALKSAFEAHPPHLEAGLKLADMLLARGEPEAALDTYRRIVAMNPGIVEAHYGAAITALQMGRDTEAMEALKSAFEAHPPHLEAGLKLADMLLARGEPEAALDTYRRIVAMNPGIVEAHYGAAITALQLGRDTEAMEALKSAFEAHPPHLEAGLKLADMLLARGEPEAALDTYRRIVAMNPGIVEAHYGAAITALQLGRDTEAMEALKSAFEAHPPHLEAGLKLADMLLARGQPEAALDFYGRLLHMAPDLAEAHYGRGVAALVLERTQEAYADLRRSCELAPDYPAAYVVQSFLSLFPQRNARHRLREGRPLICVPVLPFVRDWLGGQVYLQNFAQIVSSLPRHRRPRVIVTLLVDNWQEIATLRQTIAQLLECEAVIGVFDQRRQLIAAKAVLGRYARLSQHADGRGADWASQLFARTDFTFPLLYPCWGAVTAPGPIFWIPDLQHRFFPSNFSAAELAARDRDMFALAARPVPIIFSSHDAEMHFHQFFPRQNCRTYVWHFCTLPDAAPAVASVAEYAVLGLPERFYYTPNQFWPHKDHGTLFRALRRIIDAGHDVTFVCTGSDLTSSADAYLQSLLDLIAELDLGHHLRLLGVLPRSLQLELMRHACAIIQPSLFEGWSTVVEDARMLGRPIIASDIPVHREQIGDSAVFFTPQDPASLAATVTSLDETLSTGPDPAREAAARVELRVSARVSAERWLEILGAERRFSSSAVEAVMSSPALP